MTSQLKITPEAERDIFAITSNIRLQGSIAAALEVVAKLKNQLHTLAEYPDTGRAGGCEGTREVVIAGLPFIAVYQQQSDKAITLVRVLYGDVERRSVQR